jgi:putative endopeptidase
MGGFSLSDDKEFKSMLEDYVLKLFMLGGETKEQAQKDTELIIQIDKKLNNKSFYADSQVLDLASVQKYYKNISLKAVAAKLGYTADENKIMVYNLEALKVIGGYFDGNHNDELKAIAKFLQLINSGNLLSEDYEKLNEEFQARFDKYIETVMGKIGMYVNSDDETTEATTETTTELSEKEEEALDEVMYYFSDYVDRIYCDKFLDAQTKEEVTDLTNRIIEVYRKRLQNNEWLSDEVKTEAIKKLDNLKIVIGQNREEDIYLDDVVISNTDESGYYDNIVSILRAKNKSDSKRQNTDINEDDIELELYTANASYAPEINAIFIPAGILMNPVYDKDSTMEEKLGGIGVIIGHEISHAFDLSGSTRDENGNVRDWWTEEDREKFEELCDKVFDLHYGAEIVNGVGSYGYTVDEDVADLGGLACGLELMSELDKPDYTAFFEKYAELFGIGCKRELLQYLACVDTHSLGKVRVNLSVSCFDEFYKTYGVTENNGMYLPEKQRVRIW